MKKSLTVLVLAVVAGLLVAGCGNDAPKMSSQEKALLENSTPEVKQLFEKAWTADKANQYLSAWTNYQALAHQSLSMDQGMALQTALKNLKVRIFDAVDKGNADAKAALDYINANSPRPGR